MAAGGLKSIRESPYLPGKNIGH